VDVKAVSWVALVISLIGSMLAMSAYWRVRSLPSASPDDEVEDLKARIAQLERGHAAAPPAPADSGSPAETSSGDLSQLKRRIEALEQRQSPARFQPPDAGRPTRGNQTLIDAQKKRLFDSSQTEISRAQALNTLRMQGAHKTDDVVDAGLALLAQSKEPATRIRIIRSLQGADNARVVSPMLTLLGADPDENARQEAAGTLGDYVQQPEVKAALELAASNDASERVRRRAQAALIPRPSK
jgi:hypothetical protein